MAFNLKSAFSNLKFNSAIKAPSFNSPLRGGGIKIASPTPLGNMDSIAKALNSKLVIRK